MNTASLQTRVVLTGDGTWRGTLAEFFTNNPDLSFSEIQDIRGAIGRREAYTGGGGAGVLFTLERAFPSVDEIAAIADQTGIAAWDELCTAREFCAALDADDPLAAMAAVASKFTGRTILPPANRNSNQGIK